MDQSPKNPLMDIYYRIKRLSPGDLCLALFVAVSCGLLLRLMIPSSPIPKSQMSIYPLKFVPMEMANPLSKGCDIEIVEIKINNGKVALDSYANDIWQYDGKSLINRTCKPNILTISLNSRMNDIEILFAATPTSGTVKILPYNSRQPIDLYAPAVELRLIKFQFYPHLQPDFIQIKDIFPSYKEIIVAQKNLLINYLRGSILPSLFCFLAIMLALGIWPKIEEKWKSRWINLALAAVILNGLSLVFITGIALGMSQTGGGRYQLYSIPDAVSRHDYGLGGYLFYEDVQNASTNQALIQPDIEVLRHIQSLDKTKINFYDADDKGTGDFALFSFMIFGWNIASLFYGWFGLFALSSIIFILANFDTPRRLFALLLLNLSIYAILYLIRWANNLDSIHDPRIFGICALPGLLQLLFYILDNKKTSIANILSVLLQSIIISFCVHVRTSELWQAFCVFTFAAIIIWIRSIRNQRLKTTNTRSPAVSLAPLWPAIMLGIAIGALFVYQHFAYQAYTARQLQRHVFWHNLLMSFAFQPELREEFGLQPTDMGVVEYANQYLRENGINEKVHWHSPQRYEEVVKEIALKIIRRRPKEVLSLFFYHKPLIYAQMGLYALGTEKYIIASKSLGPFIHYTNYLGFEMFHLKYNLFRPEELIILLIGLSLLIWKRVVFTWENLAVSSWIFLWSLFPGWLIYPIMHIVIISFILLGSLFLSIITWIISAIAHKWVDFRTARI